MEHNLIMKFKPQAVSYNNNNKYLFVSYLIDKFPSCIFMQIFKLKAFFKFCLSLL